MCASYLIKKKDRTRVGFITDVRSDDFEQYADKLIVPHTVAPVVLLEKKIAVFKNMKFALLPSWSKEPKVKFATHNARLDSITAKPTWREPFAKRHCLVPLTHFIEPIYEGEHAGHMVMFHNSGEDFIMAAGIWESWVNKATGEVTESFAIITNDPPESVARVGHDRCPVFLKEGAQEEWLDSSGRKPVEMVEFLKEQTQDIDFKAIRHREMRPGWEKRK